jgi:ABC-type transport system involved in cytochrome c biogenesis ATPase subunit
VLTTLLRRPSGDGFVAGHDVVRDGLAVRQSIGYVPQAISIDGALTAYENLEFYGRRPACPGASGGERIEEAVEAMQLGVVPRPARPHALGRDAAPARDRDGAAQAPAVLFLDEPTVGLDPTARRLVWERLELLREEAGTTMLRHDAPDGGGRAPVRPDRDHGSRHDRARLAAASCGSATACRARGRLHRGHRRQARGRRELQGCPREPQTFAPARVSPR